MVVYPGSDRVKSLNMTQLITFKSVSPDLSCPCNDLNFLSILIRLFQMDSSILSWRLPPDSFAPRNDLGNDECNDGLWYIEKYIFHTCP